MCFEPLRERRPNLSFRLLFEADLVLVVVAASSEMLAQPSLKLQLFVRRGDFLVDEF
jgi:hypothetical protein